MSEFTAMCIKGECERFVQIAVSHLSIHERRNYGWTK